jgi:hypothetical protein
MRKTIYRACAVLGATLLLVTLMGCPKSTDTPAPEADPTAFYMSAQGAAGDGVSTWGWSNFKFGIAPLASKTITDAVITYAFDAAYVNSPLSDAGADWFTFDGTSTYAWLFEFTDTSVPAANTWLTATFSTDAATAAYSTPIAVGLSLKFWFSSIAAPASVYIKSIVLTYSDASTETITFTDTTGATFHSVATAGTTDPTVASRFGFDEDALNVNSNSSNCATFTTGIKTVSL